jgi:hypothetical protein
MSRKKKDEDDDIPTVSGDALDGHSSIDSWERTNGRGFWGNATTGYITDEQSKRMF